MRVSNKASNDIKRGANSATRRAMICKKSFNFDFVQTMSSLAADVDGQRKKRRLSVEKPRLDPPQRRRTVRLHRNVVTASKGSTATQRSAMASTTISGKKRPASASVQAGGGHGDASRSANLLERPAGASKRAKLTASARNASNQLHHVSGTVSVGSFEPLQEHAGASNLASMVKMFNATVDEVNAASRDERLHSYRCLSRGPDAPPDWSRDDIEIRDEWFMPHTVDEVVDNGRSRTLLDQWLSLWVRQPMILPRVCVALVRGAPGTGKTSSVRLALHKHGFNNIVEINASEVRSRALVSQRLKPLLLNSSVHGGFQRTAIVLEEVDGLYVGRGDGRGAKPKSTAAESAAPRTARASGGSSGAAASARNNGSNAAASSGTTAAAASTSSHSGADALIKFFKSDGYVPKGADRRGLAAETAASLDNEKFQRFRSTVPIILLANESHAPFMKSLVGLALDLRFYPLRVEYMRKRLVNQLSVQLNVRWTRISNRIGLVDGPLYDTLIERASGDMRKAVALMADAIRAAYARRKQLPADHKARKSNLLLLRYDDCRALLGQSNDDVIDSVPTLWGAARFLLCQLRCRCPPAICCCAKRDSVPTVHRQQQPDVRQSAECVDSTLRRPITALEQVQRVVDHDIRALPDMLFENYPQCVAEPRDYGSVDCRLAALTARRAVADAFSDAETLRSMPRFLGNGALQQCYMQRGLVAPTMLIRYPQKYAALPEQSVRRPECIDTKRQSKQINLQKSALDGEHGNSSGALAKSIRERNAYVQQFGLPYQVDLTRWFYSDNYVSKMTETRKQNQMLGRQAAVIGPNHGSAGSSRLIGTAFATQEDAMPQPIQRKMSKQERDLLRAQMERVNAACK